MLGVLAHLRSSASSEVRSNEPELRPSWPASSARRTLGVAPMLPSQLITDMVVERDRVRVRPRVVRVDGRGERGELVLDAAACCGGRRSRTTSGRRRRTCLVQNVGQLARLGDVARDQGEAELGDQLLVGGVRVADHLPAELDDAAVVERDLLDAAADPVAGLEDEHVGSARHEVAGGATDRPARPRVRRRRKTLRDLLIQVNGARLCSACQPMRTRSPSAQRSSVRAEWRFCSSTEISTPGAISNRYVVVASAVHGGLEDAVGLHHVRREVGEPHLLRAHGDGHLVADGAAVEGTGVQRHAAGQRDPGAGVRAGHQVGGADELRDEARGGSFVDVLGRAALVHPAARS